MHASRSELRSNLTRVTATRGYEGMAIFVVSLVLIVMTWSCWISSCEKQALNKFDKAIGIEHAEKGK